MNPAQRRVKLVATVGPACESEDRLAALLAAGVDVFRLNFSHGTPDSHARSVERIRRIMRAAGAGAGILADLQGPKIRTGSLAQDELRLEPGAPFTITTRPVAGNAHEVATTFGRLLDYVSPGQRLLLDDGRLELRVLAVEGEDLHCTVIQGGSLRAHAGINLPDTVVNIPAFTEKDAQDLALALDLEVDYVAMSFVQHPDDIVPLRAILRARKQLIPVVAKIEKPAALQHLDGILRAFDGAMVARGDLGVETAPEAVPIYQRRIIQLANELGKPVITATQMLESMLHSVRPTRAEASDVANAVWDGTDAVMLSGETAIGDHPREAVETLARIVQHADAHPDLMHGGQRRLSPDTQHEALIQAACDLARGPGIDALVVLTRSGRTAQLAAAARPAVPVLAVTADPAVCRRLTLHWGVRAFVLPFQAQTNAMLTVAERFFRDQGVLHEGDTVVFVGAIPMSSAQRANFLKLHRVSGSTSPRSG